MWNKTAAPIATSGLLETLYFESLSLFVFHLFFNMLDNLIEDYIFLSNTRARAQQRNHTNQKPINAFRLEIDVLNVDDGCSKDIHSMNCFSFWSDQEKLKIDWIRFNTHIKSIGFKPLDVAKIFTIFCLSLLLITEAIGEQQPIFNCGQYFVTKMVFVSVYNNSCLKSHVRPF